VAGTGCQHSRRRALQIKLLQHQEAEGELAWTCSVNCNA
jgi:hypothetical protein